MGLRSFQHLHARPGLAVVALAAVLVAACGSSAATPAATAAPATAAATATATAAPTATPAATLAASVVMPSATAVPTSLDPCQLVPASEASALAGASYTSGTEDTTSGNGKICWYGAQTKNVFEVALAQAPDVATAQAAKDAYLAQLSSATGGLPINTASLSGLGDAAEFLSFSALSINAAGIYVLKGAIFFAIVDEVTGAAAPTQAALVAEAQTVISRLP